MNLNGERHRTNLSIDEASYLELKFNGEVLKKRGICSTRANNLSDRTIVAEVGLICCRHSS